MTDLHGYCNTKITAKAVEGVHLLVVHRQTKGDGMGKHHIEAPVVDGILDPFNTFRNMVGAVACHTDDPAFGFFHPVINKVFFVVDDQFIGISVRPHSQGA